MVGVGSWAFVVGAFMIVMALAAGIFSSSFEISTQVRARQRLGWSDSVVYLGVCATCGHDLVWIAHGAQGTYVEDVTISAPHKEHPLNAAAPFEDHPDAV